MQNTKHFRLYGFIFYLVAGIAANYFTVPLLGSVELIFTPAIFLVALRTLPLKLALIVVLVSLGHLSWLWDSFHNVSLYFLESLVVYYAYHKRWDLFYADLIFWLLVGVPLATVMIYLSGPESSELIPLLLIKQPVNALAYLLLSNLILWIPVFRKNIQQPKQLKKSSIDYNNQVITIGQLLRDALLLMLLLPIFTVVILSKEAIDKQTANDFLNLNKSYSLAAKVQLDEFLLRHQQSVISLTKALTEPKSKNEIDIQTLLTDFHGIYDGFITMLIANPDGSLWFSSPPELIQAGVSVNDREYFNFPKKNLKPYLSDAFQGKGFGTDPIVAVSAPILNSSGQFAGLVEGSLNLYEFDYFVPEFEHLTMYFLVLDNQNRVVFSSEPLALKFLQKVNLSYLSDDAFEQVVRLNDNPVSFLYSEQVTENGWKIFYLTNKNDYFHNIASSYRTLFSLTLIVVILTLFLSNALARVIKRPIDQLLELLDAQGKGENVSDKSPSKLLEIKQLYQKIFDTYRQLKTAHGNEQLALETKISAEKQNEAKTELLSKVSHELRTPLNAILGQAQLMMMENPPESFNERLENIEQSSKFLVSLIDDLLQMSKMDSGAMALSYQVVEFNSVVDRAISMFEVDCEDRNIILEWDIRATEECYVEVDPKRLQQVCVNLISNAIKYNQPGGSVSISTSMLNGQIQLVVKDTGIGIDSQYYGKVFQPFQRLDQEHGDIEGSGIGLSLSYRLIKQMHGDMGFSSVKGVGSEFFITLKSVPKQEAQEEAADVVESVSLEDVSILYIEDNRVNYMIIEAWLKKYQVTEVKRAKNGTHALEQLSLWRPDIILCDLGLPDMDGIELFRKIKQLDSNLNVVALTADNAEHTQIQCRSEGFAGFVTKPVEFDVLMKELKRILQK